MAASAPLPAVCLEAGHSSPARSSLRACGYSRGPFVGKGSFGSSYRLSAPGGGDAGLLVKQIALRHRPAAARRQAFREVDLLRGCAHPNIVSFVNAFVDDEEQLNIVMEYCALGDLTGLVGKVKEPRWWSLVIQIMQGLKYLHDRRILHRDIKPSNILLSADGTAKIGDMGLGRALSPDTPFARTFCGSPLYLSPEQHREDCCYDESCDVWALGCSIHELLAGRHPFEPQSVADMLRCIAAAAPGPLPDDATPEARFLIGRMLQKLPADRPTCTQILLFAPIRRRLEVVLLRRHAAVLDGERRAAEAAHEERYAEVAAKADRLQARLQKYASKARAHADERSARPPAPP